MMVNIDAGMLKSVEYLVSVEGEDLFLRIIAALLIGTWGLLLLVGKGGFVHILVLNGLGVVAVDLMTVLRTRMTR